MTSNIPSTSMQPSEAAQIREFAIKCYDALIQTNGDVNDKAIRVSFVFELLNQLPLETQEKICCIESQGHDHLTLKAIKLSLEDTTISHCIRKIYDPALSIIKQLMGSYRKGSGNLESIQE